jgi:hypothetical protein
MRRRSVHAQRPRIITQRRGRGIPEGIKEALLLTVASMLLFQAELFNSSIKNRASILIHEVNVAFVASA